MMNQLNTNTQPHTTSYNVIHDFPVPIKYSNAIYDCLRRPKLSRMSSSPRNLPFLNLYQMSPSSSYFPMQNNIIKLRTSKKLMNRAAHITNGNGRGKVALAAGYWNCSKGLLDKNNFLTEKIAEIEAFIHTHDFDVLAVAEAGLHGIRSHTVRSFPVTTTTITNALRIPGYNIILPESWSQHDTARLFIYVKEDMTYKIINTTVYSADLPTISILVKRGKQAPTALSAHYREFTDGVSGLRTPDAQLERLVRQTEVRRQIERLQHDVIIMGDTNLCYRKWATPGNPQAALINTIKEIQADATLHQLVEDFTRFQGVNGVIEKSVIDHVYTNCSANILPIEIIDVGSSDHQGIVAKKMSHVPQEHPKTFKTRDHRGLANLIHSLYLNNVNDLITKCTTLDEAASTFNREVSYYANIHTPVRTVVAKGTPKPFITESTKVLIKQKADAFRLAKTTNSAQDMVHYKSMTKLVQMAVFSDKKAWLEAELSPEASSRSAWGRVRTMLGQSATCSPSAVTINNQMTTNRSRIATEYARLHQAKIRDLRAQVPQHPSCHPADRVRSWLRKRCTPSPTLSFKPINLQKLKQLLTRIKPGKGLPSDQIDGKTLRAIAPVLTDALLHIVNLSLMSGSFSSLWKEQMMAPRFKKGDKSNLSNFRPVSTIVEISKLCKMAAHDQVRDHFLEHDLFHHGQHGGIPKLDTSTALLQVQKYTLDAAEAKKITGTVLLDQSSAFDLVDHRILLAKLQAYFLDDNALEWFRDYLSDKSYRVRIESKSSNPHETGPYGVPQGSILGNLLFIISQNDLPDATEVDDGGQCVCFVDDETEQVSDFNPVTLQNKLQHRIYNAANWLADNMMIISLEKSKLIVSMTRELRAARHPNTNISININGTIIAATPSEKLLGITISQDMSWGPYLWGETWRTEKNHKGLIPALLQRLALLRHLTPYTSKNKMRSFVPALLISKIRYALPLYGSVWGLGGYKDQEPQKSSFTKYDISRLQSIQ